ATEHVHPALRSRLLWTADDLLVAVPQLDLRGVLRVRRPDDGATPRPLCSAAPGRARKIAPAAPGGLDVTPATPSAADRIVCLLVAAGDRSEQEGSDGPAQVRALCGDHGRLPTQNGPLVAGARTSLESGSRQRPGSSPLWSCRVSPVVSTTSWGPCRRCIDGAPGGGVPMKRTLVWMTCPETTRSKGRAMARRVRGNSKSSPAKSVSTPGRMSSAPPTSTSTPSKSPLAGGRPCWSVSIHSLHTRSPSQRA